MKVLKFGGTSVGTPASLRNVKSIIDGLQEPAVVVVSALGGITDRLIATARKAASGDITFADDFEEIVARHHDVIGEVVPPDRTANVTATVDALLSDLKRNYHGVKLIGDLPSKTLDVIVSFGERMSSVIVSAMLGATLYDSLTFVKTEKWFDKNIADAELTTALIRDTFSNFHEGVALAPGFISTDRDSDEITNLGRGGSDFTAALIAAALNASLLEIWTDVDGFMTADPRIIPGAHVLSEMSFVESMALCSYGAKVIYPPTIYPVFHKNIPIKILNTFNPSAPGTLITDRPSEDTGVKGVSAIRSAALISIAGASAENVASINTRTFNAMARHGISVYLVVQPGESPTFTFALSGGDARAAVEILIDEFAPELDESSIEAVNLRSEMSIIAVVGENISRMRGISARMSNTLQRDGIEVAAGSSSSTETSILVVVQQSRCDDALRSLHSLFFDTIQ